MRVASIDIGTNTILLLIAELDKGKVDPLVDMETIARLGEGVQKNGMLSQEAMTRGFQTLSEYMQRCRSMDVERVFAVGTSALREAANTSDFLNRVKERLDLTIDVISGEEEALFSFLSVARDLARARPAAWSEARKNLTSVRPLWWMSGEEARSLSWAKATVLTNGPVFLWGLSV